MYSKSMLTIMTIMSAMMMVIAIAAAADDATTTAKPGDMPKVEIHYLFKPENCARKAKMPDLLTLHYKGTLAATGEEFDSRYVLKGNLY